VRIHLSKPIPEEGRKPTSKECEQFRKFNIHPTTSGAWRVGWSDHGGVATPEISYYDKRSGSGCGYYFQIIEPPAPPTPPTTTANPQPKPIGSILSNQDGNSGAWFW